MTVAGHNPVLKRPRPMKSLQFQADTFDRLQEAKHDFRTASIRYDEVTREDDYRAFVEASQDCIEAAWRIADIVVFGGK